MPTRFLLDLAWRDLRAGGRPLVVFALCLMLGVALVAAGGVLHRQLATALQTEVRALFGGDVELQTDRRLPPDERAWWQARGRVAEVLQLRTMLRAPDGRSQLVELMSADAAYPLVGALRLAPTLPLAEALALRPGPDSGRHGIAVDPVLAQRLGLAPGATVGLGELTLEVRALIQHQPDRSLRAEWRGAPVLVSDAALAASGLVQPASRLEHKLRVALPAGADPSQVRRAFYAAFPRSSAELRTVSDRSDRIASLLGQVASGLLLVGFTALFIGGLGVFNSVQAYLQGKLATWATLRAVGLRDAALAWLVLAQIAMLGLAASAVGVAAGLGLAMAALAVAGERLPLAWTASAALGPALLALAFGVLTALVFAWPAVARALTVSPAALFRGLDGAALRTPRRAWLATAALSTAGLALMLLWLPDARFGLAFVAAVALLVLLLQGLGRLLAMAAQGLIASGRAMPFELRVALAGVARPGSPMRPALLSLGTSLTLLVACTVVVGSLLRTLSETVPQQAPGLVFHDLQAGERPLLDAAVAGAASLTRLETTPLVLGRVVAVNGVELQTSADERRQRAARDEHKLSHRSQAIDDVLLQQGGWWPAGHRGTPLVAMEDREALALGVRIGDRVRFEILGQPVEAELAAIYGQRRLQSRLWLEAMFSDGVLDPFVTREVGAAWLSEADAIAVQDRLAASAPHVVTVRTHALLQATRTLLTQAGAAIAVAAGACLLASLLVLASVVTASRARQVYEASVMHAVGARVGSLRRVLRWEYTLLGSVTAVFAVLCGGLLAQGLLWWRLDVDGSGMLGLGAAVAVATCALSLGAGAQWLLAGLKLSPARLLRGGA